MTTRWTISSGLSLQPACVVSCRAVQCRVVGGFGGLPPTFKEGCGCYPPLSAYPCLVAVTAWLLTVVLKGPQSCAEPSSQVSDKYLCQDVQLQGLAFAVMWHLTSSGRGRNGLGKRADTTTSAGRGIAPATLSHTDQQIYQPHRHVGGCIAPLQLQFVPFRDYCQPIRMSIRTPDGAPLSFFSSLFSPAH